LEFAAGEFGKHHFQGLQWDFWPGEADPELDLAALLRGGGEGISPAGPRFEAILAVVPAGEPIAQGTAGEAQAGGDAVEWPAVVGGAAVEGDDALAGLALLESLVLPGQAAPEATGDRAETVTGAAGQARDMARLAAAVPFAQARERILRCGGGPVVRRFF
jgi:hypothetical protein